ncbi:SusD/RagB family nutrient-binding outer membrane lipoprotein [Salegentibacter sp. Hel_I_6]|uniref:SusD/RagB family nutrient-binding outer membrane lipoprotein n=1 Tax=Salegentibacter sp. Hel_I_6 TaxID=1250278 RepID=UPI0005644411|nr:SusD/RagB family nutrient-binding outer membrane lipoprotein [Salegentibacter sp. Hel_I_6]
MKILRKTYNYIVIAGLFLTFTACDDYLDINENPNNPTTAPLAGLMVNSTFETAQNTFRIGNTTSNYVQHLASPNQGSASDVMDELSFNATWSSLYNVMTDLNDMILEANETGANHYEGVGQVLMALNLAMTVDAFGDVPFSQSFNFETITPAYDDDAELYNRVFTLLDSGIANLSQETELPIGSDDFIYNGDADQWIKFANMLKARYLNHLSKTDQYNPTEILAAIEAGFESNADDAQVEYFEEEFNPWANVAINNENLLLGGWISEQFVEATDGTTFGVEDPRLPFMIGTTDDGDYIGVPNGAGRGSAAESGERSTLVPGDFYTSEQSPVLIATYAEQKFIEAEAAFEVDKSRSYNAYLEGIRAHMRMLGVEQAEIDEYVSSAAVSVGEGDFSLDHIFKEKWIAMFLHPEAWVDARRYDYDYENFDLPENLNPDLNGQFIRRLRYPDSELGRNGSNVPEVTLLDRIFWDE